MLLLHKGPSAGPQRKSFALKTLLESPTDAEMESWKALQELLSNLQYLVHFDLNRRLYADVDASKAFRIGAVVYYVKDDDSGSATADCSNISEAPAATTRT